MKINTALFNVKFKQVPGLTDAQLSELNDNIIETYIPANSNWQITVRLTNLSIWDAFNTWYWKNSDSKVEADLFLCHRISTDGLGEPYHQYALTGVRITGVNQIYLSTCDTLCGFNLGNTETTYSVDFEIASSVPTALAVAEDAGIGCVVGMTVTR
jgi:hypothetical protein